MPTLLTHAVVVVCAGRALPTRRRLPRLFWVVVAGLAVLPDLDVIAFWLDVPYGSPWGHRGASHSLAAAALAGLVAAWVTRRRVPLPWPALAACYGAAMASHGALDALTDGGAGVAFLFPLDDTRSFAPWRPVRVSPIGLDILSGWGWAVLESEVRWLWLPSACLIALGAVLRRARRSSARERLQRSP